MTRRSDRGGVCPSWPEQAWSRAFAGTPRQVGAARRWVDSLLTGCPEAADAALLVSELASNAVRHTRSRDDTYTVAVEVTGRQVYVAVADQGGDGEPHIRVPETDTETDIEGGAEGGRGLRLIDALADQWGFRGDQHGRVVWFRLDWKTPEPSATSGAAGGPRAGRLTAPSVTDSGDGQR